MDLSSEIIISNTLTAIYAIVAVLVTAILFYYGYRLGALASILGFIALLILLVWLYMAYFRKNYIKGRKDISER